MPYALNHEYIGTINNNIIIITDCNYHVCRNIFPGTGLPNCFTREGVEQIKKAVRERNSAGDMTKLELKIPEPLPQMPMAPSFPQSQRYNVMTL
jgi:hypothetical protein